MLDEDKIAYNRWLVKLIRELGLDLLVSNNKK